MTGEQGADAIIDEGVCIDQRERGACTDRGGEQEK